MRRIASRLILLSLLTFVGCATYITTDRSANKVFTFGVPEQEIMEAIDRSEVNPENPPE